MSTEHQITIALSGGGSTHGVLHVHEGFREYPEAPAVAIAHGASHDIHHPLIARVARWLADDGGLALRFNFPYSDRGAKRPDGQKTLERCWGSRCSTPSARSRASGQSVSAPPASPSADGWPRRWRPGVIFPSTD